MQRISEIQKKFVSDILPRLQTNNFRKFPDLKLNNARLLIYKTYMQDLADFETLYTLVGHDFSKFMDSCKSLEQAKDPAAELKILIKKLAPKS